MLVCLIVVFKGYFNIWPADSSGKIWHLANTGTFAAMMMINVYCTWGIQQFVTFLGKVIYIYMYNFMYEGKIESDISSQHQIKFISRERGCQFIHAGYPFGLLAIPLRVCVHGGGNGGVYVSGGGGGCWPNTHTHTSLHFPPGDWAPYIQPSNPLLHKATTATQASLLPVARQQAPEPHHRVSLGHGCTWKCSNGSVRTKEKRQTRKTRGNTPPLNMSVGLCRSALSIMCIMRFVSLGGRSEGKGGRKMICGVSVRRLFSCRMRQQLSESTDLQHNRFKTFQKFSFVLGIW